jgi:phage virion morphogenesis (putative tail completion) protein
VIEIDDAEVLAALARVKERIVNPRPLLTEIGEDMAASTKKRFDTTTAPDGSPWLLNSVATLLQKEGDRPLTGETGLLHSTIDYDVIAATAVEIGSPMEYAAMQQFGGTKAEFPHLWGDVPAREYLGMSEEDKADILDLTVHYLL